MKSACLAAFAVLLAASPAWAEAPRFCPPTVGVVERSTGAFVYLGVDPTNPELCRIIRAGAEKSFWFGSWQTDWPGADAARAALRQIYAGPAGTTVTFDTVAAPGYSWHDTFRHAGFEDLPILGTTFHTMRIVHEREGFGGNTYHSIITQWRDLATGMTVYQNYTHISGQPENSAWYPLSVTGGK